MRKIIFSRNIIFFPAFRADQGSSNTSSDRTALQMKILRSSNTIVMDTLYSFQRSKYLKDSAE